MEIVREWQCDKCSTSFFMDLDEKPKKCPICNEEHLQDIRLAEIKLMKFNLE